jgi:hypothetical protein
MFVDAVERLVATDAEELVERLAARLPGNVHLLLGSRRPLNAARASGPRRDHRCSTAALDRCRIDDAASPAL